jgi:hypothetical protein
MTKIKYFCPACKTEITEKSIGKPCPNCKIRIKKSDVLFSITIKPRNCGICTHFNFDWTRHWCSAGEKTTIPTAEYPNTFFPNCAKFVKGHSTNHEF